MGAHQGPAHITYRHLQQIIGGLIDGIIFIDRDQRIAWANESALAMHGVATIPELGATLAGYHRRWSLKYRNHHRLARLQYPVYRLAAGEQFDSVVVEVTPRNRKDGTRIHKARGIVLHDEQGTPLSYALIIEDMTTQHEAEQRFERAFNANPAPALICRLSDLRYTRVNDGFLAMTGYRRHDVVGRNIYGIDILADADDRAQALASLHEGRTIAQTESTVPLPDGRRKHVILAGQPLEDASEPYMLLTFIDLQPRKQAEQALRQSEERFSTAFRLAPVPMLLCDLDDLRLLEVNDSFLEITGLHRDAAEQREIGELGIWHNPEQMRAIQACVRDQLRVTDVEIQVHDQEGATLDCTLSADTVTIQGTACMLAVIQDITERKHTEGELLTALDAVMQDTSWFSRKIMDQLARIRQPASTPDTGQTLELTPREREVLGLICQGHSDAEISNALSLSRNTVRNHVANIYSKIGVSRRSDAVIWGRERGFMATLKPSRRRPPQA